VWCARRKGSRHATLRPQVEGLTKLSVALFSIAGSGSGGVSDGVVGSFGSKSSLQLLPELPVLPEGSAYAVHQAASFLQWLASELAALPPGERTTALYLPLELANRVGGRVLARAIREAMTPVSPIEAP
jgi:hypothetical protein